MDDADHNGHSTPQGHAAREAARAFDRQLIGTATTAGLAALAALLNGLIARLCGVIAVTHLTVWTLIPLTLLLVTDCVLLARGAARSPQLWFVGAVWNCVTDGRRPFQLDAVVRQDALTTNQARTPWWWLAWIVHSGYAACGGLVMASWVSYATGACLFVVMIALRAWIHHVLDKQKAAALSTLAFMGWMSKPSTPGT
ncbi:hypothetical protein [Amycolatopsis alba]|uniref:Uncharacterized protein n=1 Tax=Amycolatopsis alba DSM 44262 TaxID=1125972 RepID=A0A229R930_AMYAL|nr:hypothetical protein [Amycolatopsis alba]OXM43137.1 hypothetical protein CFP75_39750 [Amycolatopsis alba DSM 44262]